MFSGHRNNHYLMRRLVSVMLLGLLLLLIVPAVTWAHPLGNFTVNRYSRLELGAEQINLLYIIDMAEIPAHQERTLIDTNADKEISPAEQDAYLADQVAVLQDKLALTLGGVPTTLVLQESTLEFPPGQANLPTLRLIAHFVAVLPAPDGDWQINYRDTNYQERIGWSEVVVRATIGARVLESSVSDQDVSQELRTYPTDLLQSPLAVNAATVRFTTQADGKLNLSPVNQTGSGAVVNTSTAPLRSNDRFAELITLPSLGPWSFLLTALAAFGWGAFHAFSPGHGKTIVGAYLVGTRGTVRHALFLGIITTITHTVGVFAFGLVTLFAARYILPETLFPWLSLLSGLLVVWIGLALAWGRWRMLKPTSLNAPVNRAQEHAGGNLLHSHGEGFSHLHALPGADGAPVSWRNLLALGVSGGLLPCPSALVMMLGAISLQRIGLGLVLIVIFSLGLASVLTGIGVVLIHAGKLFQRIPESGRLFRWLPIASALFITLVGVGIAWQALLQTGVLAL